MLLQKLKMNVPSANKVTNAFITGYRLSFNKVSRKDGSAKANIWHTGNEIDIVWGVVFDIEDGEKEALDREEGLGRGYKQMPVSVKTFEGNSMSASAYIADERAISNDLLPFDWYKEMVITGAKRNELPEDYISGLEKFKFRVDEDEVRRRLKYQIIYNED